MKSLRAFRWFLLLLLLVAALLGLGLTAGSASGLAWLLPRVAGGELQGGSGSLWTGLRAERLRLALPGQHIDIQGLDWQPARSFSLRGALSLRSLNVTRRADAPPSPPMSEQQLLAALRLPLDVELAPLRIERLRIDQLELQALRLQRAALVNGGLALDDLQLEWPQPEGALPLRASLSLQPEGLGARLRLQAQASQSSRQLLARLQADGPLRELPLQLDLSQGEGSLQLEARLAPLSAQPLLAVKGKLQALNPQAIDARLPAGHWDGELSLAPEGKFMQLQLEARNARALRLDEGGWPLRRLQARAQFDPAQWQQLRVEQLDAELGSARQGAGRLQLAPQGLPKAGEALRSELRLDALRLPGLDARWPALQLGGSLVLSRARLDQGPLALDAQLRAQPLPGLPPLLAAQKGWRLDTQAQLDGSELLLPKLELRELIDSPARLLASGKARWDRGLQASLKAEASAWRLRLPPWQADSQLDGLVEAELSQTQAKLPWIGRVQLALREPSHLAGQPLLGEAQWQGDAQAAGWRVQLQQPGDAKASSLQVQASGSQAPLRDPAQLASASAWLPDQAQWQLPALASLQALWQPWLQQLQGASQGQLQWQNGRLHSLQLGLQGLRLQAGAKSPLVQLQSLQAKLDENSRLRLELEQLQMPPQRLRRLQLDGRLNAEAGDGQAWVLSAEGDLAGRDLQLQGSSAALRRPGDGSWELPALALRVLEGETRWLTLEDAQLLGSGRQASLRVKRLLLAGEPLELRRAELALPQNGDAQLRVELDGSPRLQPWLALLQPEGGWSGDLRARLQLALETGSGAPTLRLALQREAGDLKLDRIDLGLQQLDLLLQQDSERRVQAKALLRGSGLGEAQAQLQTGAGGENLQGSLRASLPALQAFRPWLQAAVPGLLVNGRAQADLRLSGSLAAPRAEGLAEAELSQLLHAPSGAGLGQATLRLQLNEQGLQISEFKAEGLGEKGGTLSGSGGLRVQDGGSQISGDLRLQANQLRVLNRFDRRLVASGDISAQLLPQSLRVRGQLQADEGVFDIGGQSGAPTLDDDVRVLRADAPPAAPVRKRGAPRFTRDVDVKVDLGQRLRIGGRGLASRLSGQLAFVEQGGKPLQTTGRVELHGGRYRAYGQNLEIETGVLRFTGELDNPRIELLAIRPNLEQRVGVEVSGTVARLRVRLYSEPDMADSDKLAWLLLGRGPDELGRTDTAILQRAALAVLAGEGSNPASDLMDRIGLTELSVSQGDDAGTTLRLGAQLSRRWSLGYERSLDAATGSWQLVYRLGQRFRLRAQSGEASAVDLLWLWRFD